MNEASRHSCAIVFIDIVGSTELYDRLGDTRAQQAIADSLGTIDAIVRQHGGTVVKTIGDEIMCSFESAIDAVEAACDMQSRTENTATDPVPIRVRIGLHFGQVIRKQGDLFGDAVNVAARMTAIAKGGQIITTDETIEELPDSFSDKSRRFDRTPVKGKQTELTIHEILWKKEDLTALQATSLLADSAIASSLTLTHRGIETKIGPDVSAYTLGRDPDCDLTVESEFSSRKHAKIEYRRGKFVLVDQSTNGTYVSMPGTNNMYLRREEFPLLGEGIIGLGEKIGKQNDRLIYFCCS